MELLHTQIQIEWPEIFLIVVILKTQNCQNLDQVIWNYVNSKWKKYLVLKILKLIRISKVNNWPLCKLKNSNQAYVMHTNCFGKKDEKYFWPLYVITQFPFTPPIPTPSKSYINLITHRLNKFCKWALSIIDVPINLLSIYIFTILLMIIMGMNLVLLLYFCVQMNTK